MSTGRLEAFSDGVIAIAITLLVLDIKVPDPAHHGSLAHALGQEWEHYAAYAVSFLSIGVIWVNHHALLRRLQAVDHRFLLYNLVLLLFIGFIPFSTALFAEYLQRGGGRTAAIVYSASYLLMGVMFAVMQRHVMLSRPELLGQPLTEAERRGIFARNAGGVVPYVAAGALAFASPYATLGLTAVIAIFYAIPSTTA